MVTLKYLSPNNPIKPATKVFNTREELNAWVAKGNGSIKVLEIESEGAETLNRIFGRR